MDGVIELFAVYTRGKTLREGVAARTNDDPAVGSGLRIHYSEKCRA